MLTCLFWMPVLAAIRLSGEIPLSRLAQILVEAWAELWSRFGKLAALKLRAVCIQWCSDIVGHLARSFSVANWLEQFICPFDAIHSTDELFACLQKIKAEALPVIDGIFCADVVIGGLGRISVGLDSKCILRTLGWLLDSVNVDFLRITDLSKAQRSCIIAPMFHLRLLIHVVLIVFNPLHPSRLWENWGPWKNICRTRLEMYFDLYLRRL